MPISSYKAIIAKILIKEHPNADNLQLGVCQNYQVVIGKDIKDSELGVFFPADGQLSVEYVTANNLIGYIDSSGNKQGGYFGKSRRVRAQTFRGEKSEGYWAPLLSLEFTGVCFADLKEGTTFDTLGDVAICNKYFTPATLKYVRHTSKQGVKKTVEFPEHVDTKQLKYCINNIPTPSIIFVSEKAHGSSGRTGNLLHTVTNSKTVKEIIGDFIKGHGWNKQNVTKEWKFTTGTRRTILKDSCVSGFYGREEFRKNVLPTNLSDLLQQGEIIYYEIVGYTTTGRPIMPTVSTKTIRDKKFRAQYGSNMTFKYGCKEGQCKLFVYRIAHMLNNGQLIDLPWFQVQRRCRELGLETVHQLVAPIIYDLDYKDSGNLLINIEKLLEDIMSCYDATHIKEGVVLRVESEIGVQFLKYKSHNFYVLEGIIKEDENYVDMEEIN